MQQSRILVVDDSKAILIMMKEFLEELSYKVTTALSANEMFSLIEKKKPDLLIMDIRMPGISGLDALSKIKRMDSKLPVILMTAYGNTQIAIEAMKKGAYDYITKPFNKDEFKVLISEALKSGKMMKEAVFYQSKKYNLTNGVCIIGDTPQMLKIYKTIGQIADTNATVLIRGESGTGKELIARAIYQNSSRKNRPFLAVNCAAIPETLLESELFGHEKGSFTGAIYKRIGKFQQCDGGTIFLDEIGDMSLSTQTKILRVLQEHSFEPVGSEKTIKVDVRVIASTNKDLQKAIEKGEFREDLYFRLNVITIYLPPLRERVEDIPLLTNYFIQKFNKEFNKNIKRITSEVMDNLKKYSWPGNVRELENTIQTAIIMSKKDILLLEDFPLFSGKPILSTNSDSINDYEREFRNILESILEDSAHIFSNNLYKAIMSTLEKNLIKEVLWKVGKNQTKAAKILGISRNTLRTRMKRYFLIRNKKNIDNQFNKI